MKMRSLEKKLIRVLVLILVALMIAIPISWQNAFAATSTVAISDDSPEVGDSFTVTVYYSGDSFGSVDGALTYDASVLRYEDSTAQQANGGNGEVSFSHYQTSGDNSMAITFYFTVIASGSSSVTAVSSDIYNYDGQSLGGDSASAAFTVPGGGGNTQQENQNDDEEETPREKSSNANLTSLTTASGSLTPAFSSDVTSYTVTTSATETDISVLFDLADANATWDVSGSREFTGDEVTRVITITAEDGTKKEYTIKFVRNKPSGDAIVYNGTTYTPSENLNISEVPSSFLASKMNFNGKDLNIMKSRDGNVNLIKLKPEGGSEDQASWFVFNPETKEFTPAEIVTVDGAKYVAVRKGVDIIYGGSESAPSYQIYDPATGKLSSIKMDGAGQTPTETEVTPTEPQPTQENPGEAAPTEETPAASTNKKGKGLLWFILLLVLALIAALLYMMFRDKLGRRNRAYSTFEDEEYYEDNNAYDNANDVDYEEEYDNSQSGNKILLTLAGLKDSISCKLSNRKSNDHLYEDESGMSERRIERRRRIAEAEAKAAEAELTGSTYSTYEPTTVGAASSANAFVDSEPISDGSVVTKAELEAAKIAAAEKAREEAARAAAEAKAAQEAAAAAIAARDAARQAKAKVASSELDSAMEELLEVGEELNEAVNKKDE